MNRNVIYSECLYCFYLFDPVGKAVSAEIALPLLTSLPLLISLLLLASLPLLLSIDRKSTRLNSSHLTASRMPSSA